MFKCSCCIHVIQMLDCRGTAAIEHKVEVVKNAFKCSYCVFVIQGLNYRGTTAIYHTMFKRFCVI